MNKTYRVKYNHHTGTYVAVAEITTACGKSSHSVKALAPLSLVAKLVGNTLMAPVKQLGHVKAVLFSIGVLTSMAMPMAHASWSNGSGGGGSGSNNFAVVGTDAIAMGTGSAVGTGRAAAMGTRAAAYGYAANAYGQAASAYGANSIANGTSSVAVGDHAQA